jgi:3-methyladenine DNA glycosylase AlkD
VKEVAMKGFDDGEGAEAVAARMEGEIGALTVRDTAAVRAVRRRFSRELRTAPAASILAAARRLIDDYDRRWVAYELIRDHPAAFAGLDAAALEALGAGIDSWCTVDSFARTLAGPAWLAGLVGDEVIGRWARSPDRWWRRAALVSTVALNVRSHGGPGDVRRTLTVCRRLVGDKDDMVVKGLSWALRELVVHDPEAVGRFLEEFEDSLASRVKREVRNKLRTGLKNP